MPARRQVRALHHAEMPTQRRRNNREGREVKTTRRNRFPTAVAPTSFLTTQRHCEERRTPKGEKTTEARPWKGGGHTAPSAVTARRPFQKAQPVCNRGRQP